MNDVYGAKRTQKAIEQFRPIVKKAFAECLQEMKQEKEIAFSDGGNIDKIVTTEEELQGFNIVRAILAEAVDLDQIYYRDRQSYFAILYANNDQKPICRLNFNSKNWQIFIADEKKKFTKHYIDGLIDIFKYKKDLIKVAKLYQK